MIKSLLIGVMLLLYFCQAGKAQVDVVFTDLVWSDEFDNNGAVNAQKWHHQTQIPAGGNWYNNEVQHYTNRTGNSFVDGGFLNIVAKKETFTDQGYTKQYTSARLNSKFAFKYGRVDIRAQVPIGPGTWPALWLLGRNISEPGGFYNGTYGKISWPDCGEIDIMEHGIFPSQPTNFIGSAIHTPSSSGNTVNKGGILVNNLGTNYHVYSMNWSPNQITFLLDGVAYYPYNPAVKNASTWPFDAEQYLLLNIAMGGFAGTIPSNFTQAAMKIDYIRVYQNTLVDTQAPVDFTARIGAVTGSSVELLLNATDNGSSILYDVTYGSQSISTTSSSGIQKSLLITGLNPNTAYTFNIRAKDAANNQASNNPIILNATTTADSAFFCAGTSNAAQQGSFTKGYLYEFKTEGNNVKITYTLLDEDKTGLFAYLWRQSPFGETNMMNAGGKTYTHTLTGQTIGSTISYGVKFAFAGGLSVTQYYSYVVGSRCTVGTGSFAAPEVYYNNPVMGILTVHAQRKIEKAEFYDLLGRMVLSVSSDTNSIEVDRLPTGIFMMVLNTGGSRVIKKIVVQN